MEWQKVTRPKEEGGLGLQTAKGRNTALLAKLNWRFHTEAKAPWAKVLRLKYCNPQRLSSKNANCLPSSRTWKGLKQGEEIFKRELDGCLALKVSLTSGMIVGLLSDL